MTNSSKSSGDLLGVFFWKMFYFRIRLTRMLNGLIRLKFLFKGVKIGRNVDFIGFPVMRRYPNSTIFIGNDCTFNSSRHSVLVGCPNPCTFVTLKENSEIILGKNVGATSVIMVAHSRIVIGNNVKIGANCIIIDNDFHNPDPNIRLLKDIVPSRPITIEDNVFLGFNCYVLKGVTIGENSVIGANSVVLNDIPRNAIAIGNPCKLVMRKSWEKSF